MYHLISEDIDTYFVGLLTVDPDHSINTIKALSKVNKKFSRLLIHRLREWDDFMDDLMSEDEFYIDETDELYVGKEHIYAKCSVCYGAWIMKRYLTIDFVRQNYQSYFHDAYLFSTGLESLEYLVTLINNIAIQNESFQKQWTDFVQNEFNTTLIYKQGKISLPSGDKLVYVLNLEEKYFTKKNLNPVLLLEYGVKYSFAQVVKYVLSNYRFKISDDIIIYTDKCCAINSLVQLICDYPDKYDEHIIDILEEELQIVFDFRPYANDLCQRYPRNSLIKRVLIQSATRNQYFDQTFVIGLMKKVCSKTTDKEFLEYLVNCCTVHSYKIKLFNKNSDIFKKAILLQSLPMIQYMVQLRDTYHPHNPYEIWQCWETTVTQSKDMDNNSIRPILEFFVSVNQSTKSINNRLYSCHIIPCMIEKNYHSDDILDMYMLCKDHMKWTAEDLQRLAFDACEYGKLSVLKYLIEVESIPFDIHTNKRDFLISAANDGHVDMWNYLVDLSFKQKPILFSPSTKVRTYNKYPIVPFLKRNFIDRILELLRLDHHSKHCCVMIKKTMELNNYDRSYLKTMDEIIDAKN